MDGLSLVSIGNAATREVVRGELHLHTIAGQDADVVLAHLARDLCENGMAAVDLHPEHQAGERLDDLSFDLDLLFLDRHSLLGSGPLSSATDDTQKHGAARLRRR